IGDALGLDSNDVAAVRSAGYLHDIGKVAVDKRLFGKPTVLDAEEFQEMADHTTVGHQIVTGVQFPWPFVPEVVRWHHERADGSGGQLAPTDIDQLAANLQHKTSNGRLYLT